MSGITSYAQNFEDVMLWRALGTVEKGYYIDIGAQDPVVDSVSKAFYERGWRGIHVEPTMAFANLLRQQRPDEIVLAAAAAANHGVIRFFEIGQGGLSTAREDIARDHDPEIISETTVTTVTLDEIMDLAPVEDIHWLKIDVEGFETEVLTGWKTSQRRPWIIVIEATYPNTPLSTAKDWEHLVLQKGYKLVYQDGLNRFYLSHTHQDLEDRFRYPPNVFDKFELSGFSTSLTTNLRKAFERNIAQLAERETHWKESYEAGCIELSTIRAKLHERENALAVSTSEQTKLAARSQAREREFNELEARLHECHSSATIALQHEHQARLEKLQEQLNEQSRQALNTFSIALSAQENLYQRQYSAVNAAHKVELNAQIDRIRRIEEAYAAEKTSNLEALEKLANNHAAQLLNTRLEHRQALRIALDDQGLRHQTATDRIALAHASEIQKLARDASITRETHQRQIDAIREAHAAHQSSLQDRIEGLQQALVASGIANDAECERLKRNSELQIREIIAAHSATEDKLQALSDARVSAIAAEKQSLKIALDKLTFAHESQAQSISETEQKLKDGFQRVTQTLAELKANVSVLVDTVSQPSSSVDRPTNRGLDLLGHFMRTPVTAHPPNTNGPPLFNSGKGIAMNISGTHDPNFQEFLSLPAEEFVRESYQMILGRDADESGLRHFVNFLHSGGGRASALWDLAHSDEANDIHRFRDLANLSDSEFVESIYMRLLGRTPDRDGRKHFLELIKKRRGRARMIWDLQLSNEYAARYPDVAKKFRQLDQLIQGERGTRGWRGWLQRGAAIQKQLNRVHEQVCVIRSKVAELENRIQAEWHLAASKFPLQTAAESSLNTAHHIDDVPRKSEASAAPLRLPAAEGLKHLSGRDPIRFFVELESLLANSVDAERLSKSMGRHASQ